MAKKRVQLKEGDIIKFNRELIPNGKVRPVPGEYKGKVSFIAASKKFVSVIESDCPNGLDEFFVEVSTFTMDVNRRYKL